MIEQLFQVTRLAGILRLLFSRLQTLNT